MSIVRCPKCGAPLELVPLDNISPAARAILDRAERFKRGYVPTIREIARVIGYSYWPTHCALQELVELGYVLRIPTGPRKHKYRIAHVHIND